MKTNLLMFCAVVLLALPVLAHEGKEGDAKWEACKGDAETLCKDVEPGGGRIMDCLKAHEAELSAGCQAAGGEGKKAKMDWEAACAKDKESFCKDVEPGEGRIIRCFKEHEKDLSEGCRGFMSKKKEELMVKQPSMRACEADKEKFCAGVEPGEGRIIDCMKAHREELSAACRDFMPKKGGAPGGTKDDAKKKSGGVKP